MSPEVQELLKKLEQDHVRHKLELQPVILKNPLTGLAWLGYLEGYYNATVASIHQVVAMQSEIRQVISKQEEVK